MRKSMLIPLAMLVVFGCDQPATAPPDTDGPSYNWSNNPDVGNLRIARFDDFALVCWTDPDTQLRVCHATLPMGNAANRDPDCGLQGAEDPIDVQQVGLVDEANFLSSWLHSVAMGDVFITVRDMTQPGVCFGRRLVAEGWGTFVSTDNDFLGVQPDDNNANAWGYLGFGKLTSPDGLTTYQYQGVERFIFTNKNGFKILVSKVQLQ